MHKNYAYISVISSKLNHFKTVILILSFFNKLAQNLAILIYFLVA